MMHDIIHVPQTMPDFVDQILPFRTKEYNTGLCQKLYETGFADPSDLLRSSREALDVKFSNQAELVDVVSLQSALERQQSKRSSRESLIGDPVIKDEVMPMPTPHRRHGSRSRSFEGGKGGRRGSRGAHIRRRSRPHRPHVRQMQTDREEVEHKPPIWSAVENGEDEVVAALLAEGCSVEDCYQGWTPLMKAAEEGVVNIMKVLLQHRADIEAANKKGRTALSFAAAPSRHRATPTEAIKTLLVHNADPYRKDMAGLTPKARAHREKRADAVLIFDEYGVHM